MAVCLRPSSDTEGARARKARVDCQTQKPHLCGVGFLFCSMRSLTITYFHMGVHTIIGVESFHGPVRDGKGWYQLAMVIRHDLSLRRLRGKRHNQSGEEVVDLRGLSAFGVTGVTLGCACMGTTLNLNLVVCLPPSGGGPE